MKSFLLPSLMLSLLLLLLGGCSLFSASEDDEARIIFGERYRFLSLPWSFRCTVEKCLR